MYSDANKNWKEHVLVKSLGKCQIYIIRAQTQATLSTWLGQLPPLIRRSLHGACSFFFSPKGSLWLLHFGGN